MATAAVNANGLIGVQLYLKYIETLTQATRQSVKLLHKYAAENNIPLDHPVFTKQTVVGHSDDMSDATLLQLATAMLRACAGAREGRRSHLAYAGDEWICAFPTSVELRRRLNKLHLSDADINVLVQSFRRVRNRRLKNMSRKRIQDRQQTDPYTI